MRLYFTQELEKKIKDINEREKRFYCLESNQKSATDECPSDSEQKLSQIDRTVPSTHIQAMNTLFDCTEDDEEGAQYYDLILNPERFTGFQTVY